MRKKAYWEKNLFELVRRTSTDLPADVELAKKIAAELQVVGKVTGTTDFDGGVSVVIDGNCINHNSFVSRVAKVQTLQSGKVASILYA